MKVLILSCNTGGGHNTAARAVSQALTDKKIESKIVDALSFSSQLASDLVCNSYLDMVKYTPRLFGEIYNLGEHIATPNAKNSKIKSPVYLVNKIYADELKEYIEKNEFTTVVCTHIFPAEAVTYLKRKRKISTKNFFVVTDYSCTPLLEETELDCIFIPQKDLIQEFINRGIKKEKLNPTGIPVSKNFAYSEEKKISRAKLGIPGNDKVFLVMSGSMGYGDSVETSRFLLKQGNKNTKVIVLTANNDELKKKLESIFSSDERLITVPFTDKVELFMNASDILLTKPGGLSTTEAAVKNIPIIHTSPIPGCETLNAEYFSEHNMSIISSNSEKAATMAWQLINDEFRMNQMIEAQKHYINKNASIDIANTIICSCQ